MKFFTRAIFVVVSIIVLLKLSVLLFIQPWLKNKIESLVNTSSNPYHITINKVHFSFFLTGIQLREINIHTDTLILTDNNGSTEFTGSIKEISLNGINYFKALANGEFEVNEVIFSNPLITTRQLNKDVKEKHTPALSPENIHIGKLSFDNADYMLTDDNPVQKIKSLSVKNGYLTVENIHCKKSDTLSFNMIDKWNISARQIVALTSDNFYTLEVSGIKYNNEQLTIDSAQSIPNYPENEFASLQETEVDRINATLLGITFHNFALNNYLSEKSIVSQYVTLQKLNLRAFRDKRKPDQHGLKHLIQDVLYDYPYLIKIDSVDVMNGYIEYKEHADGALNPGKIFFTHVRATMNQVTNDSIYKSKKGEVKVHCEGLIVDKAQLKADFSFPLYDAQNTFTCSGNLASMKLENLNDILENNAFISVKSGTARSMKFNFTANNMKATGRMIFLYDDLNIEAINKKTDDTKGLKQKVKTFVANAFIVKNSNPSPHEPVREGVIAYKRDPEKAIFNYCWKALAEGFKSSIGVKEMKTEKKEKKQKRIKRKQDRKDKRAAKKHH